MKLRIVKNSEILSGNHFIDYNLNDVFILTEDYRVYYNNNFIEVLPISIQENIKEYVEIDTEVYLEQPIEDIYNVYKKHIFSYFYIGHHSSITKLAEALELNKEIVKRLCLYLQKLSYIEMYHNGYKLTTLGREHAVELIKVV